MNLLDVMSILEKYFYKILVINIKENSYKIIKIDKNEAVLHTDFVQWWKDFADENIHPKDRDRYLNFINVFKNGSVLFYRRKCGISWKWVAAEFLETDNSTSMNPEYILLIRDCSKGIIRTLSDSGAFKLESRILKDKNDWYNLVQTNKEKLCAFYIKSDEITKMESIIQSYFTNIITYQVAVNKMIVITKLNPTDFKQKIRYVQKEIFNNNIHYTIGVAHGEDLPAMTNIAINNMKDY